MPKYYLASTTRIALRKYVIPQSMEVEYLLGDHLGSTALTTDAAGKKVSEMRYTPWGEVRYAWKDPGLNTTPAYALTKWTFTGQYRDSYINLLWYGSRHYDSELGRFISPDTIVPLATQGVQAWDRYAYANNSPSRYTDPTGHKACDDEYGDCLKHPVKPSKPSIPLRPSRQEPRFLPRTYPDGLEGTGPITDLFLWLPGTADAYNTGARVFDVLAWLTDAYAAGAVTYGGIFGAGLTGPFIAAGLPEVPVATGFAGMAIAELIVQPVLNVGNGLATLSTFSTVIAETKSGATRIEEGRLSNAVVNSVILTGIGWVNKEAYISLTVQSAAVANDFGWTRFSIGNTYWNSLPLPSAP